jgi:hypothetical protein
MYLEIIDNAVLFEKCSSTRYIFRRLSAFLWSDFVHKTFQILFIDPSAKPTRARVLVTN